MTRADELLARQRTVGINDDEAAWLEEWQNDHDPPPEWDDDQQIGTDHRTDLDVFLDGSTVWGVPRYVQYIAGSPRIGGGWGWKLSSIRTPRGWERGWYADVFGVEAFAHALGVTAPSWLDTPLGPFYNRGCTRWDELTARKALLNRLISILRFVSCTATNIAFELISEPSPVPGLMYGLPSCEQHVVGDWDKPGGWGWSVTSYHASARDYGCLADAKGLCAFSTAMGADFPEGADEEMSIRLCLEPESDYEVAYHRVGLRLLAMLRLASQIALDKNPSAASVMAIQRLRFEEEVERETGRVLGQLRDRLEGLDPDYPIDGDEVMP